MSLFVQVLNEVMYVYDKNNSSEVTVAKKYKGREDLSVTFVQVLNKDIYGK